MPQSLSTLEARRSELLRALTGLKDRRPGSIVGAAWRCGKPNCRLRQVIFTGCRKSGQVDLKAVELPVRDSMHRAGAAALERLFDAFPATGTRAALAATRHSTTGSESSRS